MTALSQCQVRVRTDCAQFARKNQEGSIRKKMSVLWAWGANSCGQLGLGDKCEQHEEPVAVADLAGVRVVQVAGGGSHTLVLTQEGRVYAAGSNARQA